MVFDEDSNELFVLQSAIARRADSDTLFDLEPERRVSARSGL